ncbi:MAG: class I SAM-dependent methyltransferase [bacterium]|nr:class I SAM-dependent methyltransferase [Gammaproteobacteria bacterium]HIL94652.1 class I SAM-dependent methyltransferase [Pseudomonadales bacterium]
MKLPIDVESIKGFLDPVEGESLFDHCLQSAVLGPILEIGSYCGKSTIYLGTACKQSGRTLFAVDHHRGSEEHQFGEEFHDPDLYDQSAGLMDSFQAFRHALRLAELEDHVVPLVAPSDVAARDWQTPLGMVFIDGGHSLEAAMTDYESWAKHILPKGILAIHDIFPNPEDGGQAPFTIWKKAIDSGLFEDIGVVRTLGVLRRKHS